VATALFTTVLLVAVIRNGDLGDGEALVIFPGLVVILAISGVVGAFLWPRKRKRPDLNVFN
jgi:hypothetical protein